MKSIRFLKTGLYENKNYVFYTLMDSNPIQETFMFVSYLPLAVI